MTENMVDDVFAVIIEERHSGIGMVGVYASLDAALAAADEALSEYADGYGPDDIERWDSGRGSCGVQWGDGNQIIVERTQLHPAP